MAPEIDLSKLTVAEKDALILSLLPLIGRLDAALARIAELEARLALLEKPPKTPDNSSLPPSKGQKRDQPSDGNKPPRKRHCRRCVLREIFDLVTAIYQPSFFAIHVADFRRRDDHPQ